MDVADDFYELFIRDKRTVCTMKPKTGIFEDYLPFEGSPRV